MLRPKTVVSFFLLQPLKSVTAVIVGFVTFNSDVPRSLFLQIIIQRQAESNAFHTVVAVEQAFALIVFSHSLLISNSHISGVWGFS